MHFSALLIPTLAALASAQTTTSAPSTTSAQSSNSAQSGTTIVSIFEGTGDSPASGVSISVSMFKSLGGSVVGINADYTTYKLECMSGAATSDCSVDPYTVLAGPETLSFAKPLPVSLWGTTVTVDQDVQCSFTRTSESAVCTETQTVSVDDTSTSTVTTQSIPSDSVSWYPITVTAGLSKFNSPQATQAPNAAAVHRPMVTAAPLGAAAALAAAAFL